MAREIKFRGYHVEDKVMVYKINSLKLYDGILKEDDYILMQFTGLQDKNGKDIYEGDICKIPVWFGATYTLCPLSIIFKKGMFCYELYCGSGDYECMSLEYSKDMEIIGNIYETPELLGDNNEI